MMVRPDGFIGAVMAIEGIADAQVLLHGPDGCRKNLTVLSKHCFPRGRRTGAGEQFFKGLSRIPCTDVVSSDYIFGSYGKVVKALDSLKSCGAGLIAVIPTPGAALIGDDCYRAIRESGTEDLAFVLDASPKGGPLSHGFDRAICEAVRRTAAPKGDRRKDAVVLLGVSILMKDWTAVVDEFSELLSLMGLEVVCVPGAGSSSEEIANSVDAEYGIVLCPEYAVLTSELYESGYGVRIVSLGYSPIGFDATLAWINKVAECTGKDPSAALEKIHRSMIRAFRCMEAASPRIAGVEFSVDAEASIAYPMVRWLMESFSMMPSGITMPPGGSTESMEALSAYLESKGIGHVIGKEDGSPSDVVLRDGNTARLMQSSGRCLKGIDISFPSITNVDFTPSPIFGASGALYLLDRLMNPMRSRSPHAEADKKRRRIGMRIRTPILKKFTDSLSPCRRSRRTHGRRPCIPPHRDRGRTYR